jgi:hypothetical protein
MDSYIRYFKNILSFIVKPIIDKEYLLPVSNTQDTVKCKDFDIDNDNWVAIGGHYRLPYNNSYYYYNNSV